MCEKVLENVESDNEIVVSSTFEHTNVENKLVLHKEVEILRVDVDVFNVQNDISFTYDIDFIGFDDALTQGRSLANYGYDILEVCFIGIGKHE